MKNKIIILIFLCIISLINFKNLSFAKKNNEILNKMIDSVHGNTVEYGIRANFEINENGEKYCLDLLKELNLLSNNINITRDEKFYSVEFNKAEENGYIEYSSYDNHNIVTLNIVKSDNINRLDELKAHIEMVISKEGNNVKYYQYLKAKILENENEKLNDKIINILKAENAINISSVNLKNGISTVAYTKQFNSIKSNGKLMDLNFALCSYSSGNYLIIGTPIIIEAY